jgi:hypothetical protein
VVAAALLEWIAGRRDPAPAIDFPAGGVDQPIADAAAVVLRPSLSRSVKVLAIHLVLWSGPVLALALALGRQHVLVEEGILARAALCKELEDGFGGKAAGQPAPDPASVPQSSVQAPVSCRRPSVTDCRQTSLRGFAEPKFVLSSCLQTIRIQRLRWPETLRTSIADWFPLKARPPPMTPA